MTKIITLVLGFLVSGSAFAGSSTTTSCSSFILNSAKFGRVLVSTSDYQVAALSQGMNPTISSSGFTVASAMSLENPSVEVSALEGATLGIQKIVVLENDPKTGSPVMAVKLSLPSRLADFNLPSQSLIYTVCTESQDGGGL